MTRTLIFSCYYNRTDFLSLQYIAFANFFQGDYRFVVCNDAPYDKRNLLTGGLAREDIQKECDNLGIEHRLVPQNIHTSQSPVYRCAAAYDWMLHTYDFTGYDYVYLCDSDCFLTDHLNPDDYMKNLDIKGVRFVMGDVTYYTEHALFIRTSTIAPSSISLAPIFIDGHHTDVGGWLCPYLRTRPEIRCGTVFHTYCKHQEGKMVDLDLKDPIPDEYHQLLYDEGTTKEERQNFLTQCPLSTAMLRFCQDSYELACQSCSRNDIKVGGDWRGDFYHGTLFYHHSEGGNWDNKPTEYHQQRSVILANFIYGLTEERKNLSYNK